MEIMLIRHAMTAGNLQRRYVGSTDEGLCPEGIELAEQKAQAAALAVGIIGALILGTGMSLCMTELGAAMGHLVMVIGILAGVLGLIMVALAFPFVYSVIRFYRNLFTGEGYLSFTLPVTPANHLWVKVVTAVSFSLLSVLVAALSGVIITAGESGIAALKTSGIIPASITAVTPPWE